MRPAFGRGGYAAFLETVEEFRGVYQALQQKHLPFDVLQLGGLTSVPLDRYRLVVLPGVGAIGQDAAAALDEFVARGGNLLSTGNSGFTSDGGAELGRVSRAAPDPAPSCPARRCGPPTPLSTNNHASTRTRSAARSSPCMAPTHDPRAGAVGPARAVLGHTATGDPAVASTGYDSGTSSMFMWTIGRTYREFAKTEVRDHLLSVLEPLAGIAVSAELPEQVELILGRDDDGHVVHLLNQTGTRRRSFGPHVPVGDGRLVVRDPTGDERATALVARRELQARRDGDVLVIELPVIDLFEVVRIHGIR